MLLACSTVFLSCSSEDLNELTNSNIQSKSTMNITHVGGIRIVLEKDILSFKNYDDFKQAVKNLKNNQQILSNIQNIIPIHEEDKSLNIDGFNSIYDDYVSALSEADNYYDSENKYKEFKNKYPNLYFPEHDDDYSVYLPVSDKATAKLLNSNGDVKINGQIVNMKDITTYDQLVELGETMTTNGISTFDYTGNYLNGTPQLENGGNRRLTIKVYTEPGSSGVAEVIVVDVSFRKKGFLGAWYNYKSDTTLGWVPGASWSKSGFSSHDYKFARVYQNQTPVKFKGRMFVDYQGFRGEKVYFNVDI